MRTKLIIAGVVIAAACRDDTLGPLPERPGANHGGPAFSVSSVEFPVGTGPEGVAFDGANIWVANGGSGNVTKLRARDGANLGTFPAGVVPNQLASDGTNMWVADHASADVNKLRASDGTNLGTFPVGTGPFGVTFDGANIWVAAIHTDDVTKLRASDGANLGVFALGDDARQLAFDGVNMWVTHGSSSVTRLRASDGANLGTFAVGSLPIGVAFDGTNIWVVNNSSGSVTKLRASDGANLGTFVVGTAPRYVAFDGTNIWVSNEGSNNVTKLRARDGANLGTFPVGISPEGVAFDGSSIWVANAGSNTVSKVRANGKGSPGGVLTIGSDRDVSNTPHSWEGETGAAANSSVIVGASMSSGSATGQEIRAYTSSDGVSWTSTTISRTWNGTTFDVAADPSVDTDADGSFYLAFLGGPHPSPGFPNSITVSKADANGLSWGTPVAVTYNASGIFDDKPYIAIDRSPGHYRNRIYVSWDRVDLSAGKKIVPISFSDDGGQTWSTPMQVDDGNLRCDTATEPYPAVDANTGVVYDSWWNCGKGLIYVDKSVNGGVSWGKDAPAAATHISGLSDISCVGPFKQGPAHHVKVGPSGTLHLVYADNTASRGFDIFYARSTNGGTSWSKPLRLNDDRGVAHQFQPTLAVSSNGSGGDRLVVTFMDRRDDTPTPEHPNGCLSHVYATGSSDNGLTWSSNVRVTTASSNYDPYGPGDYSSSTPSPLGVFPFFGDHRNPNSNPDFEIYTAPIQFSAPVP